MDYVETFPIVTERGPDGPRIVPAGELDIATVPLLDAAVEAVQETDDTTIVIDLSGITFIDSTGLQLLLRLSERHRERLEIIPSPAVLRLLDVTGVREKLPLRDGS